MTSRVPPVGPVGGVGGATGGGPVTPVVTRAATGERRGGERRSAERRAKDEAKRDEAKKAASALRDLVPVGKPVHHDPAGPAASKRPLTEAQAAAAAFAAQMLGQGGQRNGIRGGPPVLDAARSTYLGAEYTGEKERRPQVGTTKRKDI